MCSFKNCKGRHACLLAGVSPCRDHQKPVDIAESDDFGPALSARARRGFIDMSEMVTPANANSDVALRRVPTRQL